MPELITHLNLVLTYLEPDQKLNPTFPSTQLLQPIPEAIKTRGLGTN